MTMRWMVLAGLGLAGVSLIAAQPAEARTRYKVPSACVDRPTPFSWNAFFFNGKPQPNGCAPAVVDYGQYVGQDPDANVLLQLRRDPNNGYTYNGR